MKKKISVLEERNAILKENNFLNMASLRSCPLPFISVICFLEFEECLNRNPLKYFPSHRILKSCSKKFTDHLNAI